MLAANDLELDTGLHEGVPRAGGALPRVAHRHKPHRRSSPLTAARPIRRGLELMRRAAAHPQVYCKVSGLMDLRSQVKPAPTDVDFYAPVLDSLWDLFGEDRLIYGSDWPVSDRKWPRVRRHTALGDDVFYRARRRSDGESTFGATPKPPISGSTAPTHSSTRVVLVKVLARFKIAGR